MEKILLRIYLTLSKMIPLRIIYSRQSWKMGFDKIISVSDRERDGWLLGCLRSQLRYTKRAAGGYGSGYGYQKYPQKVWAPSRARSASDNHLKFYLYSYTNKTVGLEAIFNIPCFQSSKKPKCPMCCPYGPTDLSYKIWGHAASVCPFCKDLNFSQFIV